MQDNNLNYIKNNSCPVQVAWQMHSRLIENVKCLHWQWIPSGIICGCPCFCKFSIWIFDLAPQADSDDEEAILFPVQDARMLYENLWKYAGTVLFDAYQLDVFLVFSLQAGQSEQILVTAYHYQFSHYYLLHPSFPIIYTFWHGPAVLFQRCSLEEASQKQLWNCLILSLFWPAFQYP